MAALVAAFLSQGASAQLPDTTPASFDEAITAFNYGDNDLAIQQFRKLANEGDSRAQYYLAYMMDSGLGTAKDEAGASSWYKKSAQQDYLPAIVYMGYMYSSAHGVQRDDKEAFKWYTRAAQMGDAIAQNNLATMLQRGVPYAKNEPLAAQWFMQAAMQGNMRAQYNLATMYRTGDGIKKNLGEAMRWYSFAANQGDMYAQNALGYMYRKGEGVDPPPKDAEGKGPTDEQKKQWVVANQQSAIEWYRRAAEQGHVKSQMAIAIMYELGEAGSDKGLDDAMQWYFHAAGQGNERAMHRLGYLYERGRECVDFQDRKCFDENNKPLSDMATKGQGPAKDEKEAFRWYKKAADERNYPPSIIALASFYETGRGGVKEDIKKALELYQKGACYKEPLAMLELGRLYRGDKATFNKKPDLVRSYQWYGLARNELQRRQREGNATGAEDSMMAEALKVITQMGVGMSEPDKENAKRLIAGWRPCANVFTVRPRTSTAPALPYDRVEEDEDNK